MDSSSTTTDPLTHRVMEIAAEQVGADLSQVNSATRFVEDLGFDSLDVAEFTLEIEDEYEVGIPDEQVDRLKTVQAVVDWIQAQQHAA
ncbi:MAG: acyl carrier protein [Planctomycetota bacterium]